MADLKPCPFCGSSAEIKVIESERGRRSVIRCKNLNCYMGFPGEFISWNNGDTDERSALRLTAAWNRRADNGKRKATD